MSTSAISPTLPSPTGERPWPAQGEWTYEDYLRLPDDGLRYEIIEGVLYVANAPSHENQFVLPGLEILAADLFATAEPGK